MESQTPELPPLPAPEWLGIGSLDMREDVFGFTADQMREYARAAIAAAVQKEREALAVCELFIDTIRTVEDRCMAVDGPVTKTCDEITDAELSAVYVAAEAVVRAAKEQRK